MTAEKVISLLKQVILIVKDLVTLEKRVLKTVGKLVSSENMLY